MQIACKARYWKSESAVRHRLQLLRTGHWATQRHCLLCNEESPAQTGLRKQTSLSTTGVEARDIGRPEPKKTGKDTGRESSCSRSTRQYSKRAFGTAPPPQIAEPR